MIDLAAEASDFEKCKPILADLVRFIFIYFVTYLELHNNF